MKATLTALIFIVGLLAPTLMEISTPTHPRTSKKHGKRQAEGGGQFSHRRSVAGNV
jgi:hypothetical protein